MANHGTLPRKRWKVFTERIEAMKTILKGATGSPGNPFAIK
jgi:hypothetical protein